MVRTAPHHGLDRRRHTNLNNLTLLCRYHHHNFAARGWTCRINAHGLPEWTPPRWSTATNDP